MYWYQVREAGQSGDGIESLINKVESFLAQGKLSEAADALEKGLKDTHAAEIVDDWVKRARNRAITEQALTLLQSYATTISTWNSDPLLQSNVQFICCLQKSLKNGFLVINMLTFSMLATLSLFSSCCNPSSYASLDPDNFHW